jgi:hypothetical protein
MPTVTNSPAIRSRGGPTTPGKAAAKPGSASHRKRVSVLIPADLLARAQAALHTQNTTETIMAALNAVDQRQKREAAKAGCRAALAKCDPAEFDKPLPPECYEDLYQ